MVQFCYHIRQIRLATGELFGVASSLPSYIITT